MPEGEERARSLQPRLAGERFDAVLSSPLQRARRTAVLAGFADPTPEPLLVEWNYGDYEGVTSREIHSQRPDWDLWRDGCPGGESPEDVRGRATRLLQSLEARGTASVIVFSHGHFLRMLCIVFLELPLESGARLNLDTAALSVLRKSDRGHLLQLWNDTGHLPGSSA